MFRQALEPSANAWLAEFVRQNVRNSAELRALGRADDYVESWRYGAVETSDS